MLAKEDSLGATLTYSSVRMIRRRQAIVSPDMVQRYEQRSSSRYHAVKPQRSTSSSSETSDDDSERRLNFLASKYCCNYGNRRDNDDDPSKGNGGASIGPSKSGNELVSGNAINTSDNTSCSNDCHYSEQSSQYRSSLGLKLLDITQMAPTILHPIKEMQAVLFPHSLFPSL
ncbi:Protein kinase domain containing protein [Brugia malayi]|uniref:Bm7490, isoform b n=1 Tax=Brugia malayi TaxID=6279 RepID=A0A0J9Y478_BRUMA|nr:Protein kinase domain containing protein [Brugia malayi]CDQ01928.1 Bm7490, isoform b [Brugia malayi]VIO96039.1 Protein kinase domain containing protein [Brugia malayi]